MVKSAHFMRSRLAGAAHALWMVPRSRKSRSRLTPEKQQAGLREIVENPVGLRASCTGGAALLVIPTRYVPDSLLLTAANGGLRALS